MGSLSPHLHGTTLIDFAWPAGPPHRKPKKWNVKYSLFPKQAPAYCTALQYCCLRTILNSIQSQMSGKIEFFLAFQHQGFPPKELNCFLCFKVSRWRNLKVVVFQNLSSFHLSYPTTAAFLLWIMCPLSHSLTLSLHQHKPHNHNNSAAFFTKATN